MSRAGSRIAAKCWPWMLLVCALTRPAIALAAAPRPNILWITCEDMSPNLGAFGDAFASSPHLDKLAREGVRYTRAFAPIGVCAPSRSTLITGVYATALGTQHMRSQGRLPDAVRLLPQRLREAGYYCSNNSKTDYNFTVPRDAWDESSGQAHWRQRGAGQPFFSVFNLQITHEGQIRMPQARFDKLVAALAPEQRRDAAAVPLPPYHPDLPEVRADWTRYYELISLMDRQAGALLQQLADDGLDDETIVFFFSDHGAGMPRSKRWLFESSVRVPLIIRFPEAFRQSAPAPAGGECDRLVSFVDFAPTVLSLAGVPAGQAMQGVAFLGPAAGEPRQYVFGFRDRMDERYDMQRSVRDGRYRLIRNYHPERPWFGEQHLSYLYEMPTMRAWQAAANAGQLKGAAARFMERDKPPVELYDLEQDPWEIDNLAEVATLAAVRARLERALDDWLDETIDLGFLPEDQLQSRFGDAAPYDAVRQRPESYPLQRIRAVAELASRRAPSSLGRLLVLLDDEEAAIRFWAASGLAAQRSLSPEALQQLDAHLADPAAAVRIAVADALVRHQRLAAAVPALSAAMDDPDPSVRLSAAGVLDRIADRVPEAKARLLAARGDKNAYVARVAAHAAGEN